MQIATFEQAETESVHGRREWCARFAPGPNGLIAPVCCGDHLDSGFQDSCPGCLATWKETQEHLIAAYSVELAPVVVPVSGGLRAVYPE